MRRSNSNKSTSGVSRSKSARSTTSFRSALERLEHIDPAIADRDAHLAATLSWCQAAPTMVPTAHHPPLRSVFTEYSGDSGSQQGTLDGTCDENGLRRQKSVRFAKSSKNDAANGTGISRRRSVLGRIENQQNCAAAQKTDESPCFNPFTAKFVESLPPAESYRPVDECASVPGQTPTPKYYFSNSPEQGNPTPALRRKSMQNIKESKSPKRNRSLRAPKSMSFLKSTGTRSNLRTNASEGENSGNNFGGDGQASLQSRTSRLFTSNKEGIRQSMRDPSAGNLAVPKRNGSLRKKARKVSSGFKTRLSPYEFEAVSPEKPSGPPAPPAVDSQRVYSALMNRLYEVNQKENMREASGEDSQKQEAKKLRRSLVDSPPAIRCVRPEDDVFRDARILDLQ
ncbi:hypothetical protein K4K57_012064 [Colletotrichum sp. SAR 10_99]|nr:hypothetical protein K4K56_009150 [Colletotrichum sp. SAR 10_98]KAJ5019603.1 hypothetical protein K4K57_012064 [Colletotrichum sp. SAR 10_99]